MVPLNIAVIVLALSAIAIPAYLSQAQDTLVNPQITQVIPTPTQTPSITITQPKEPQDISPISSKLHYPNSIEINSKDNITTLESTDDHILITNWYKEKIKAMGATSTSFVSTNTNGNILNTLIGNTGSEEIRVEITKKDYQPKVIIALKSNG